MTYVSRIKIGIIALLAVVTAMYFHQQPITNELIVALELSPSRDIIANHLRAFDIELFKQCFRIHVYYDFLLMLSYVFLLSSWLLHITTSTKEKFWRAWGKVFLYLLFLAATLDGIEDFLMYQYFINNNDIVLSVYISAAKFLLLFSIIIFILSHIYHTIKKGI